jgi:PBSX family phage terminase large subunit
MKTKAAPFKFTPFSKKQMKVLTWWMPDSPVKDKDAIIADGSVRAGKTLIMSLSFIIWAMETFNFCNFGMAGKTIGSFRRNVLFLLKIILRLRGYKIQDKRADNLLIVRRRKTNTINYFYIFGGKDERSQDLVQGITAAGFFFDEVALMPQSFVNQAVARCSVEGSKLWFNCNPEGPYHWFKLNWLDKLVEKNALHLHFTMDDNPSLSEKVKDRYRRMFAGLFFKRYILGLWVMAEGIIYDMFDENKHKVPTVDRKYTEYYVSCDYGTQNPTVFGLWGKYQGKWYKVKEYYYSGRDQAKQKTDEEFYQDLVKFIGDISIKAVIVDPSAASFIACIKKHGKYRVLKAKNDVLDGIRNVGTALKEGLIAFNDCCIDSFREFYSYVWDEKAAARGEDKPVKQNDHTKDEERYFVNTVIFGSTKVKAVQSLY